MNEPTIVPFGGMRAKPGTVHPLVSYVLDLTGKERAKVAMLSTALGDSPEAIVGSYSRIPAERAERRHVSLFSRTIADLRGFLLSQDVIWVGGGNTANMLAVWRVHGVHEILSEAWEAGVLLTGGSAGSLCWYEGGTTDSFNLAQLEPLHDGLGLLPGSHCPHYDGEEQRRPLYHSLIASGLADGIAIDDDAAVRYVGTNLVEVVTARAGATAYRVELVEGEVRETPLEARLLEGGTDA